MDWGGHSLDTVVSQVFPASRRAELPAQSMRQTSIVNTHDRSSMASARHASSVSSVCIDYTGRSLKGHSAHTDSNVTTLCYNRGSQTLSCHFSLAKHASIPLPSQAEYEKETGSVPTRASSPLGYLFLSQQQLIWADKPGLRVWYRNVHDHIEARFHSDKGKMFHLDKISSGLICNIYEGWLPWGINDVNASLVVIYWPMKWRPTSSGLKQATPSR